MSQYNFLLESQIDIDRTASWGASSVITTQKNIDFPKPASPVKEYELIIMNPSRVTDLTVSAYNLETLFNGETMAALLETVAIPATTAEVLDDCEDAWDSRQGANVVVATEGTIKKVGTNSVKLTVGAGAIAGLLATEAFTAANLSGRTHLELWLYSSVAMAAGDLQICIDDTADCASPLETINLPALAVNTWKRCTVPLFNPITDLAVISVGIKMAVDKGAFNLYVDDVNAVTMSVQAKLIHGMFNGGNVRLALSNDTALGADDAFTAYTRIREVM